MENTNYLPIALAAAGGLMALLTAFGAWRFLREKLDVLFDHLAAKTHLGFLANLDEMLVGFATDLYRTEIKILKEEGRWNSETKRRCFELLKQVAIKHFGFAQLAELAGGSEVGEFVAARAHTAITEAKARGKAAKADPSKA